MRWALASSLAVLLGSVQAVPAEQPAPLAQRFGDWTVIELATEGCVLHQRLAYRETGTPIADLWLQAQEGGSVVLSVQVPVGASLSELIAYRHGNDLTRIVPLIWQFCSATHCLAQAHLQAAEADRLRRGRFVELAFRPLPDSAPLVSVVSLAGVTRGLAAQETCRTTVSGQAGGEDLP